MANSQLDSYKDVVQNHQDQLDALLRKGVYQPVFIYHVVIFNMLPLIGLLIPRRGTTRFVRPGMFVICVAIAAEVLTRRRALLGGHGYMIGLMTAWWLLWSAALFVFLDVENDVRRIERGPRAAESILAEHGHQDLSKGAATASARKASRLSGNVCHENGQALATESTKPGDETFHWQSYPRKMTHRAEWCAGLLFNLRGPEWNWRQPHLGPLPRSVYNQVGRGFETGRFQVQDDTTYPRAQDRLRAAFWQFLQAYLLLDCLKVIMMRDVYFRGWTTQNAPPPVPFSYVAAYPVLVRLYRSFVSGMGVFVALNFVTSLNPIFFLGLSTAFPNAARKLTGAPLGASWLYADAFGPFGSSLLDHGIAGCWGRWWHQLFRHGFATTARFILSLLPEKWSASSRVKQLIYVLVSFTASGLVHAAGSLSQFGDTSPISGPFLFFFSQGIAMIVERTIKTDVLPRLGLGQIPRPLCRAINAVYVCSWLLYSGALIADDFARGGLWLIDPIPISPLRGLGLASDKGWWCWDSPWFGYWSDGTYWGSGIRLL
ncbi:Uncharacterized protein PECH_005482 [Penicillium ucsense]|uniref:Wax synthase domain-containing protein n=1 Tax=Penicillium ucsense TaxID=2839758 RepID=A0A8J8W7G4_9EURO|nr:Uncharacterized protein PECM_005493 [Penicillium ucsense]KAF7736249.1 Uncharacterized protein PECH_005482 [Penicillium ucsense]